MASKTVQAAINMAIRRISFSLRSTSERSHISGVRANLPAVKKFQQQSMTRGVTAVEICMNRFVSPTSKSIPMKDEYMTKHAEGWTNTLSDRFRSHGKKLKVNPPVKDLTAWTHFPTQHSLPLSNARSHSTSRSSLVKKHQLMLQRQKERQKRLKEREENASVENPPATEEDRLAVSPSVASSEETLSSSAMHLQPGVDMSGLAVSNEQPPPTQALVGPLMPESHEEEKLAGLVARPDLMITRQVEFLNVIVGFEQQNRYVIIDPHKGLTVGFLLEQSNAILRQILRTHRPWTVNVYNAAGELLCVIKRKFFFITSTATVEIGGKEVGWVHRRWHLWKRNYDVYVADGEGRKVQFAAMENAGFWWWTFTLKDEDGETIAEIDRNFRGLGLELFTDAGQYMVRFGDTSTGNVASHSPESESIGQSQELSGPEAQQKLHDIAKAADQVPKLDVVRPLTLVERAVTLALAVSIDNDFFSRHGSEGGILPLGLWGTSEV